MTRRDDAGPAGIHASSSVPGPRSANSPGTAPELRQAEPAPPQDPASLRSGRRSWTEPVRSGPRPRPGRPPPRRRVARSPRPRDAPRVARSGSRWKPPAARSGAAAPRSAWSGTRTAMVSPRRPGRASGSAVGVTRSTGRASALGQVHALPGHVASERRIRRLGDQHRRRHVAATLLGVQQPLHRVGVKAAAPMP